MTEEEVQARVDFKINEVITGLKNRIALSQKLSFLLIEKNTGDSLKHFHYSECFQDILSMIIKERDMDVPNNNTHMQNLKAKRDIAVAAIYDRFESLTRGYSLMSERQQILKFIVSEIEKALNI